VSDFFWEPSPEFVRDANLTRLGTRLGCASYDELHRASVDEPDRFWPELVSDLGLVFTQHWDETVDASDGPEWARWFVGGKLNAATSCVHRWAAERPDDEAAVWLSEDGRREALTWRELSTEVARLAEGLGSLGIGPGDAVGVYLPMAPQVAIATFAVAQLGAVLVPIFSGFAATAVATRLDDAKAKAVITADASFRRGQVVPMKEILDDALRDAPTVTHTVVWRRHGRETPMVIGRDRWWDELVEGRDGIDPVDVDATEPFLIAYTSGTTGRPKGAVHTHGAFLVSIAREPAYLCDVKPGDRILFATDMGWIMGPWVVVGGMANGATVVFLEGAPDWPTDRLWRAVESERLTMLGLSPTLIRALVPHGAPSGDFSSLRTVCTTGEPLNPEPSRWLYEHVCESRAPIVNVSGGTECAAVLLAACVIEPLKEISVGFPALGIDADVVDANGNSVRGSVGELVIRKPWPGMTRGIWGDDGRYLETYWRTFPGMWRHGDWASVDKDWYWFLHGRSDDTLNIAGKRIGPSELESAAMGSGIVAEAAAVGVPHDVKGEVAWLFCVARPGVAADEDSTARVSEAVTAELGKAFKPDRIVWVSGLPKTRSAKIVRRAVRAQVLGRDPGDLSTLENPETLEEIARVV
jgi:acetyl-CoA synthetase